MKFMRPPSLALLLCPMALLFVGIGWRVPRNIWAEHVARQDAIGRMFQAECLVGRTGGLAGNDFVEAGIALVASQAAEFREVEAGSQDVSKVFAHNYDNMFVGTPSQVFFSYFFSR
jgi:hypothetical protein